jgi:hypothetical protein
MIRNTRSLLTFLFACAGPASAQIIPIRTVPLARGDQFFLFPSNNLGMGGVSLALADSLLDPFRNPAMGVQVSGAQLFVSPVAYSSSRQAGGGRTLPVSILGRAGSWFGGVSAAIQQVDNSGTINSFPEPLALPRGGVIANTVDGTGSSSSHGNAYAFGSIGKALGTGLSVGASVQWSGLKALDGVDLLYPGRQDLAQSGHGVDLRLGMLKEWPGSRTLEALVLHNQFSMTHNVTYLDLFWDPANQTFLQTARVERNLDRAQTTGVHLAYQRPLTASGWQIGWIGTANFVANPRIARNEVVTIPRDQGRSAAYNVGVGFAKLLGPGRFGVDLVYEPIWSRSWAVADAPALTDLGDTIPVGARTIENRFRFANLVLRLGVGRDLTLTGMTKAVGLDLGLALRSMHYRLVQSDHLAEWSPTWGLSLRFPELELKYRGRVINGNGRPGSPGFFGGPLIDVAPNSFVLTPGSDLSLAGVSTITHQITLSLPLR